MKSTTQSQLIYHNILRSRIARMKAKLRGDMELANEYTKELASLWLAYSKQKKEETK